MNQLRNIGLNTFRNIYQAQSVLIVTYAYTYFYLNMSLPVDLRQIKAN